MSVDVSDGVGKAPTGDVLTTSPEARTSGPASTSGPVSTAGPAVVALAGWVTELGRLHRDVSDDAFRIDLVRALEVVKAASAAAQARLSADLDASQRGLQAAAGVPAAERGRGVAAQVALARRDSPYRGGRHLGLAKALVHEMPHTLAALGTGRISEWRATILVRETAVLTREDRTAVDAELAGDAARVQALEQLGDRALAARAKQVAYRLDPRSVVERSRRAKGERCVTIRPAPDTMAYLTALLPARDAIAVHTALGRTADSARNAGDPRGRGQLMADSLVAGITEPGARGGATAGASAGDAATARTGDRAGTTWDIPATGAPPPRPGPRDVAIRLVMTDRALLDGDDEPAHLDGYGPVPAAWARELVASTLEGTSDETGGAATTEARVFLTRILTDAGGALVAMESRARTAPAGLADLIRTRDGGTCRTSWCDAPVRHVDHVTPHARGGPTSADNGQGLCEACNHVKTALGWRAEVTDPPSDLPGRHFVVTTTPTGHRYQSQAPPLPGTDSSPVPRAAPDRDHDTQDARSSVVELLLREQLGLTA